MQRQRFGLDHYLLLSAKSRRLWVRGESIPFKSHQPWDLLITSRYGYHAMLLQSSLQWRPSSWLFCNGIFMKLNKETKTSSQYGSSRVPLQHRVSLGWACLLQPLFKPPRKNSVFTMHKFALSSEHIVSILSVPSYVLCSYLYSGLTNDTRRTLFSFDDGFISSRISRSLQPPYGFEGEDVWLSTRLQ